MKDLLTAGLVVAGVVLLAIAWIRRPSDQEVRPFEEEARIRVAVEELLGDFEFPGGLPDVREGDLLALFVLNTEVCPPCLHETAELAQLLGELDTGGVPVQPLALVFEEDGQEGSRFLATAQLPMAGGHGLPSQSEQQLTRLRSLAVRQQLIFVDTATETLFYRSLIPSAITPVEAKRSTLERVLAAYRELRSDLPATS